MAFRTGGGQVGLPVDDAGEGDEDEATSSTVQNLRASFWTAVSSPLKKKKRQKNVIIIRRHKHHMIRHETRTLPVTVM